MNLFANTAPPVRQDLLTNATDACVVLAFVVNTVKLVGAWILTLTLHFCAGYNWLRNLTPHFHAIRLQQNLLWPPRSRFPALRTSCTRIFFALWLVHLIACYMSTSYGPKKCSVSKFYTKNIWAKICWIFTDIGGCCTGNECSENALCRNLHGSYNCTCKEGYYGDGKNCTGKTSSFFIFSARFVRRVNLRLTENEIMNMKIRGCRWVFQYSIRVK